MYTCEPGPVSLTLYLLVRSKLFLDSTAMEVSKNNPMIPYLCLRLSVLHRREDLELEVGLEWPNLMICITWSISLLPSNAVPALWKANSIG